MLNDFELAKKWMLAQLELEPKDAEVLNYLGVIEATQRNARQAEKYFQEAYQADTTDVRAPLNLGRLYEWVGQRDQAERWLLKTLQIDGSSGDVYLLLGRIYSQNPQRQPQALACFRKAAELLPERAEMIRKQNIEPLEAKIR